MERPPYKYHPDDTWAAKYSSEHLAHWETIAQRIGKAWNLGGYYHNRLVKVFQTLVEPNQRIVEFGCGQGDLLAGLKPAFGVGIDFSPTMLERARLRHPELHFIQADIHDVKRDEYIIGNGLLTAGFDIIICSDLLDDIWDIQAVLELAGDLALPDARLIINSYSRLWELPLTLGQSLGIAQPMLQRNWLTMEDIKNLCELTNFEVIRQWQEILWPLRTPLLDRFCNQYLVKLWPINHLGLTNFTIARMHPEPRQTPSIVSVIVPARNEAGNIPAIFERTPEMGQYTELVFVEGHSADNTYEVIAQAITEHPERICKLLRQTGIGKGDAVRTGFTNASGEIFMILDADLTVPPEDLPRFYHALIDGHGDFINGVRLVYPMEKQAMRFLNLLGNKFFSLAFSWLLGQPIKDTLCGTKVLWKTDYEKIVANRAYFGDFDPFGDFDLIFGAVKLNRKIIDLPIRYRERKYGTTNIERWKHGWLLLRMMFIAAKRVKFV